MAKDMYQKRRERKEKTMSNDSTQQGCQKNVINWYPGHMAKAKREIFENISNVDIIIEVVDARIPVSSHIKETEEYLQNKNIILVFNKYDLCDKNETTKFINYYKEKGYITVTCDSKNTCDYKKIIDKINFIMKDTNEKRKLKGLLPKKAKAIVIGVPNVGKSTLINKFVGRTINKVSNKPGVTRNISLLRINNNVDLFDTPGILWPKIQTEEQALNLASMSIIKEEVLPQDKVAIHIIDKLSKYYSSISLKEFNIKEFDKNDLLKMYEIINNYKHFALYQGEIDFDRINLYTINLIKSEKVKSITFDIFV